MKKKYYKAVLSYTNASLINEWSTKYQVKYKLNRLTLPKLGTKLFVSDSLDTLKRVYGGLKNVAIYECDAVNPRKPHASRLMTFHMFNETEITRYWDIINTARKSKKSAESLLVSARLVGRENIISWPHGTIWCDAVKITKRIYDMH